VFQVVPDQRPLNDCVYVCVYISDDVTCNINYHRIFKCTFLFCRLISLCASSVKGINLCRFSYIRLKGRIVRFILHHPVCTSVSFGGEGSLGQETADVGCE